MQEKSIEDATSVRTSVVIPTKDSIDTIDKCLSSLMPYHKQGYISEIVIVDGHSTDGTLDALKNYPVKLIFEKGKGTISIAFDIGWREAQGELVIFLNSDVYLGENFFPRIYELLSDKVGWISCLEKAVVSNRLTKAQAESWSASAPMLAPSPSLLRRLYYRVTSGGNRKALCGGPCMLARRSCLEATNGLQGLSLATLAVCGDICFSERIAGRGWQTIWWLDAPVYHHPQHTFRRLIKQFYDYGKSLAYMHLEKEFRDSYPWHSKLLSIMARLASPVISISLAIRFRNPLHIIVYPIPRYAGAIGYIVGWIGAKKSSQPMYSEPGIPPAK